MSKDEKAKLVSTISNYTEYTDYPCHFERLLWSTRTHPARASTSSTTMATARSMFTRSICLD